MSVSWRCECVCVLHPSLPPLTCSPPTHSAAEVGTNDGLLLMLLLLLMLCCLGMMLMKWNGNPTDLLLKQLVHVAFVFGRFGVAILVVAVFVLNFIAC